MEFLYESDHANQSYSEVISQGSVFVLHMVVCFLILWKKYSSMNVQWKRIRGTLL